uniref:Uncharacterized protein n=1 Tax=mine drainage metagenome TaxID=410659 RepID=E6PWW7_9ZZZZ
MPAPACSSSQNYASSAFTISLTTRPSARNPSTASRACTALITAPISFAPGFWPLDAATTSIAARTSPRNSSSPNAFGKKPSIKTISTASFAASSGRFPLVNCSIESRRCLIIPANTCCCSASVTGSADFARFSITLFFSAALIIRSVVVRSPSRAFIDSIVAFFTCSSNVSAILISFPVLPL